MATDYIRKPPTDIIYKDFDFRFIAHPVTGNLSILENEEAIKQAVKLLVLTNRNEILFNPDCYGGVGDSLFENITSFTEVTLRSRIEDVVRNYEPRAKVQDVVVNEVSDTNEIRIRILLTMENRSDPIPIEIFLERIR